MSCFIDHTWQPGEAQAFQSKDPLERETLWSGHSASEAQIISAVQCSKNAFSKWSLLSFADRALYLSNYNELLIKKKTELAQLISREMGKPFWESLTEVQAMIAKFELSKQAQLERCSTTVKTIAEAKSITRYHPIGVCLILGPFNLPAHLPNGHLVPALLAGNTVIFKPSEKTPAVGAFMMRCLEEAQFPKGVVQLLQGDATTAKTCVKTAGIDIIAFTGSHRAGVEIHKACAGQPEKMLALEMGGNNPLIVWNVKDVKSAAYNTLLSAFITSGQRCVCARRLILPYGNEADLFIETLKQQMSTLQVKAWDDHPEGFMGPLIDAQAAHSVLASQQKALAAGAKQIMTCRTLKESKSMLSPGLLEWQSVNSYETALGDEETFGPLLQIFRAESFEHAVQIANRTKFGLAAGLFSDQPKHWDYFQQHIKAGITNWNRQLTGAFSSAPFGGIGKSGNFRPSAYHAVDYCSYVSASIELPRLETPLTLMPGLETSI